MQIKIVQAIEKIFFKEHFRKRETQLQNWSDIVDFSTLQPQ